MEYKYDSQTISPRDASCQHSKGNANVHFAISLQTVNCQLSTVNWIHTFSAKEKDTETGLSYFGARYYSSDLSIWLSVDPMSDKYPPLSPYVYCANSPIKLVDPEGEEMVESQYKWEYNQTTHELKYVGDDGGRFHQTVEMTKNESDRKHEKFTVDYTGSITYMFNFSVFSSKIDGLINGSLDILNGGKTFVAGATLGIATEGTGTALAAATCMLGAGQVVEGIKKVTETLDGQESNPYLQQEIIKEICKTTVNLGSGAIKDFIEKSGKVLKNVLRSTIVNFVWLEAQYNKTKKPKFKRIPIGATIKNDIQ